MPNDAVLQVRLDAKTKTRAEKIFKRLGISSADAVRMFFSQTIEEKGLPFQPHIPNAETRKAIEECRSGRGEVVPPAELKKRILGKA